MVVFKVMHPEMLIPGTTKAGFPLLYVIIFGFKKVLMLFISLSIFRNVLTALYIISVGFQLCK